MKAVHAQWLVATLLLAACAGGGSAAPAPNTGVAVVEDPAVADFYGSATRFYRTLEGRRFNSVTTFRDRALRDYFRDDLTFSNYYADLALALTEVDLERNRPLETSIEEFLVEGPGRARVRVRIGGNNGLPLRFWSVSVLREDEWERHDGRWWIVTGSS